ncbi:MAG: DUF3783 domain-containing protein [Ruminococcaceae bacterium]|nr:DUF3783 domain-containing protein [Oscillospiraceae bacterium]
MPTLLLFNVAARKHAALQVIALRCGCRVQPVRPQQYGTALRQILSGETADSAPAQPFAEELLVMDGLSERQMDMVLTELRRRRVPIALKAVVTPTNASWTPQALYEELCREREAFAAGRQAHT